MREGGREKEWERCGKVIKKRDGKAGIQAIKKEVGEELYPDRKRQRRRRSCNTKVDDDQVPNHNAPPPPPPPPSAGGRPKGETPPSPLPSSLCVSSALFRGGVQNCEAATAAPPPLPPPPPPRPKGGRVGPRRGRRATTVSHGSGSGEAEGRGGGGGGGEEVKCFVQSGHKWGKVSSARKRTERKRDVGASGALVK